jgi:hypothetical protein
VAVVLFQDTGSQCGESCDLGIEGVTAQVEVDAVLYGFRLRYQLEEQSRRTRRLGYNCRVVFRVSDAVHAQTVKFCLVIGGYFVVVEGCGPEPGNRGRVPAIKGDILNACHGCDRATAVVAEHGSSFRTGSRVRMSARTGLSLCCVGLVPWISLSVMRATTATVSPSMSSRSRSYLERPEGRLTGALQVF